MYDYCTKLQGSGVQFKLLKLRPYVSKNVNNAFQVGKLTKIATVVFKEDVSGFFLHMSKFDNQEENMQTQRQNIS